MSLNAGIRTTLLSPTSLITTDPLKCEGIILSIDYTKGTEDYYQLSFKLRDPALINDYDLLETDANLNFILVKRNVLISGVIAVPLVGNALATIINCIPIGADLSNIGNITINVFKHNFQGF